MAGEKKIDLNFNDDYVLVYVLFLLDSLQTGMVTADAFHWFVFGFGNLAQLDDTFLNSWDVVLIDAVVASIVHTFYCWRIYLLRKSYILPIFIMLVGLFIYILTPHLTSLPGFPHTMWSRNLHRRRCQFFFHEN